MTALAAGSRGARLPFGGLIRRRPEVVVWLLVVSAWVLLLVAGHSWWTGGPASDPASGGGHQHHGAGGGGEAASGAFTSIGLGAGTWAVMVMVVMVAAMVVAMMVPTVTPTLYRIAVDSFPRRRHRAMGLFLCGYLGLWWAAGLVGLATLSLLGAAGIPRSVGSVDLVLVAVVLLALAYELSPPKRRALRRCQLGYHLPPRGRAADRACVRAGVAHGRACLASCWALMLIPLVAGHGLLLMLVVTAVVWAQRLMLRSRAASRVGVVGVVAAGAVLAAG